MSKIIIGIHGLGNKPAKRQLQKWWKMALREGLSGPSGLGLFRFRLVYWASVLYSQPLQIGVQDKDDPLFLKDPYVRGGSGPEESEKKSAFRKILRRHINEQLDRIFLDEDGTMNFSKITDFILKQYFQDLDAYYNSPAGGREENLPSEAICSLLADGLRKHRNRKILLIAHSMGSIIAWDVLTRYVPEIEIDTFITIGSPLGMPLVKGRLLKDAPSESGNKLQLRTPENIRRAWFNLADFEDRVAFSHDLREDFLANTRGIRPHDVLVRNSYEYKGEPNPHKSYGYLRCREMAEIIHDFLRAHV